MPRQRNLLAPTSQVMNHMSQIVSVERFCKQFLHTALSNLYKILLHNIVSKNYIAFKLSECMYRSLCIYFYIMHLFKNHHEILDHFNLCLRLGLFFFPFGGFFTVAIIFTLEGATGIFVLVLRNCHFDVL